MITIRVVTKSGTNASKIGEAYGSIDGVAWRNAVDWCDIDGCGRVFLDCDDEDTAKHVFELLDTDGKVAWFGF